MLHAKKIVQYSGVAVARRVDGIFHGSLGVSLNDQIDFLIDEIILLFPTNTDLWQDSLQQLSKPPVPPLSYGLLVTMNSSLASP